MAMLTATGMHGNDDHTIHINAHHSCYVFVDNGNGQPLWNGDHSSSSKPTTKEKKTAKSKLSADMKLRLGLEEAVATKYRLTTVVLVIQGQPRLIDDILESARCGRPVLVLVDSGGAAAALYDYCTRGIRHVEEMFQPFESQLRELAQLNEAYRQKQLHFFRLGEGHACDPPLPIETCRLVSLCRARAEPDDDRTDETATTSADLGLALLQCIVDMMTEVPLWYCLPVGTPVSHEARGPGTIVKIHDDGRREVRFDDGEQHKYKTTSMHKFEFDQKHALLEDHLPAQALRKALVLTVVLDEPSLSQRVLAAIFSQKQSVTSLDAQIEDVRAGLQRAVELQREKHTKLFSEVVGLEISDVDMHQLYLVHEENSFLSSNIQFQLRLRQLRNQAMSKSGAAKYGVYVKAVAPFFASISPTLSTLLQESIVAQTHDVFFWLCCQGTDSSLKMARNIWAQCDLPIHIALLGAQVSKKRLRSSKGHQGSGDGSNDMEQWAVGALSCAKKEEDAHYVIGCSILSNTQYDAMDIARASQAKQFLSQHHVTSLMNLRWRGAGNPESHVVLPQGFSWLMLIVNVLCPLFVGRYVELDEQFMTGSTRDGAKLQQYTDAAIRDAFRVWLRIFSRERIKTLAKYSSPDSANKAGRSAMEHQEEHDKVNFNRLGEVDHATSPPTMARVAYHLIRKGMQVRNDFYAVPAVKFCVRALVAFLDLVLHCNLIFGLKPPSEQHEDPSWSHLPRRLLDSTWGEWAWLVLRLGQILDQQYQVMTRRRLHGPDAVGFEVSFMRLNLISKTLFVVALALRLAVEAIRDDGEIESLLDAYHFNNATGIDDDSARTLYEAYQAVVSMMGLLSMLLCLPFMAEYRPLGVLIVTIIEMLKDVVTFMMLFVTVNIGFSIALCGLQYAGMYRDRSISSDAQFSRRALRAVASATAGGSQVGGEFSTFDPLDPFTPEGGFWVPWWSTFGYFNPDDYNTYVSLLMWYALCAAVGVHTAHTLACPCSPVHVCT